MMNRQEMAELIEKRIAEGRTPEELIPKMSRRLLTDCFETLIEASGYSAPEMAATAELSSGEMATVAGPLLRHGYDPEVLFDELSPDERFRALSTFAEEAPEILKRVDGFRPEHLLENYEWFRGYGARIDLNWTILKAAEEFLAEKVGYLLGLGASPEILLRKLGIVAREKEFRAFLNHGVPPKLVAASCDATRVIGSLKLFFGYDGCEEIDADELVERNNCGIPGNAVPYLLSLRPKKIYALLKAISSGAAEANLDGLYKAGVDIASLKEKVTSDGLLKKYQWFLDHGAKVDLVDYLGDIRVSDHLEMLLSEGIPFAKLRPMLTTRTLEVQLEAYISYCSRTQLDEVCEEIGSETKARHFGLLTWYGAHLDAQKIADDLFPMRIAPYVDVLVQNGAKVAISELIDYLEDEPGDLVRNAKQLLEAGGDPNRIAGLLRTSGEFLGRLDDLLAAGADPDLITTMIDTNCLTSEIREKLSNCGASLWLE